MKNKEIKMQEIIPYWTYFKEQKIGLLKISQNSVLNLKNIFTWKKFIIIKGSTYFYSA